MMFSEFLNHNVYFCNGFLLKSRVLIFLNLVFNDMTNHIMLRTAANRARRHTAQSHNRTSTTQTLANTQYMCTRSRLLS